MGPIRGQAAAGTLLVCHDWIVPSSQSLSLKLPGQSEYAEHCSVKKLHHWVWHNSKFSEVSPGLNLAISQERLGVPGPKVSAFTKNASSH
eukprot:1157975-Pelagomonas_calceolata.AAC.13